MKGIMCSKFKVVVALLFLSSVLRRFFSLDKNSKKKKKSHLLKCLDLGPYIVMLSVFSLDTIGK